jgi:hypothetical protein
MNGTLERLGSSSIPTVYRSTICDLEGGYMGVDVKLRIWGPGGASSGDGSSRPRTDRISCSSGAVQVSLWTAPRHFPGRFPPQIAQRRPRMAARSHPRPTT